MTVRAKAVQKVYKTAGRMTIYLAKGFMAMMRGPNRARRGRGRYQCPKRGRDRTEVTTLLVLTPQPLLPVGCLRTRDRAGTHMSAGPLAANECARNDSRKQPENQPFTRIATGTSPSCTLRPDALDTKPTYSDNRTTFANASHWASSHYMLWRKWAWKNHACVSRSPPFFVRDAIRGLSRGAPASPPPPSVAS
jgi:hypothetical protein